MTSAASRRSVRFLYVALIVAAVAALGRGEPSAQSAPPPLYGLTPIGVLGGSQSAAYDISPYGGVIVGRAQTAGGAYHAFVEGYDPRTDIGALGGTDSTAFGASSSLAVGQAQTAGGQYHAFTFHPRTKAKVDLGTLGGTWSAAYDASDEIVVGDRGSPATRACGRFNTRTERCRRSPSISAVTARARRQPRRRHRRPGLHRRQRVVPPLSTEQRCDDVARPGQPQRYRQPHQ